PNGLKSEKPKPSTKRIKEGIKEPSNEDKNATNIESFISKNFVACTFSKTNGAKIPIMMGRIQITGK
ncbi:MAG: hypothetical protein NC918_00870, partial [Candidatus Omnitrophica bacterium]|nr:hypothetical protein [Candidatus Omnitrophota bacterium]